MRARLKAHAAWLLLAMLAVEAFLLAETVPEDFPYLASALLGAVVVLLRARPRPTELLTTCGLAIVFALARFGSHLDTLWARPSWIGTFLGLASLLVLGARMARRRLPDSAEHVRAFVAAFAVPAFVLVPPLVLPGTAAAHPLTYDRLLYVFDGSLGFQASFVLGRFLARQPWLAWPVKLCYEQVPLAVVTLHAWTLGVREREGSRILLLFGVASMAGYLLYNLLPATGPVYLFPGEFPRAEPAWVGLSPLPTVMSSNIPRNAIPSLHMTWALLLCCNARGFPRWIRIGAGSFLVLTVLATLGLGEHYLVDLVAALPFALAVQASGRTPLRDLPSSLPFLAGSFGTLGWLAFLRYGAAGWSSATLLDWSLIAVTIVGFVLLERRTARGRAPRIEATA
jgi:hypothetical protein